MTSEIRSLLSELAVLADQVERDEQRILDAALERLKRPRTRKNAGCLGRLQGAQKPYFEGFSAFRKSVHKAYTGA